jgi:hypothetical protein
MPVDPGRLRELVMNDDAHAIALDRLDRGTWHRVIKSPYVEVKAGKEFSTGVLAVEVKLLGAILDCEG